MALDLFTEQTSNHADNMNPIIEQVNKNTSAIGQISNPPININPDFKIWQRYDVSDSTTFTNPINKYIADRYRFNGTGTVKPVANGAKITGTINVKYILEDSDFQKLNGKTLTRSWSENNVIEKETFVCNNTIIFDKTITDKTVNFIKIELGEIATPLSPRPYGEELALCQRYYERSYDISPTEDNGEIMYKPYNTSANGMFGGAFKVAKRVKPTIKIYASRAGTLNNVRDVDSGADKVCGVYSGSRDIIGWIDAGIVVAGNRLAWHYEADAEIY